MALYDWPINQYKFPSEGLLYDNVNPYADSMGLMSGAYSPWETPAGESGWSNPWFKGPDVTWGSPDQEYVDYMQKLADDEAAAIRNANNTNNINNPYYDGSDGEGTGPVGPNTGPMADFVDWGLGNLESYAYGVQDKLGAFAEMLGMGGPSAEAEAAAAAGGATMGGMDQ